MIFAAVTENGDDKMTVTQKCQYALRAVYEMALRQDGAPCKIGVIANSQGIPVRFLENILNGLKGAGIVDSVRGKDGGYFLTRLADKITVGEIIRFVQGPFDPVGCSEREESSCGIYDDCVFRPLWEKARIALETVYDSTTIQDLVDQTQSSCSVPGCNCGKKKSGKTNELGQKLL